MFYEEPAKKLPVSASVDVLVLGAGPAGVAAAISAGRQGAKTMLIEQLGDVGGIATSGLMSHWTGNTRGGIYEEFLDRSADLPDSADYGFNGSPRQLINPERLKTVFLQMLHEAHCEVLLYTFVCEPIMDSGRLSGVIIENKSGRQAIFAKIIIDSTGDGDIAAKAGAAYVKGRETDGAMQPASLMFKIGGVDYSRAVFPGKFEDYIQIPKGEIQALGKLICASNINKVLTDFIRTGVYNRNRQFYPTTSPSMDILISSNLERLLYLLTGEDDAQIREWFTALAEKGTYEVTDAVKAKLTEQFYGGFCDDAETKATIAELYQKYGYTCDTHTAVAVKVYEDYRKETGDTTKTLIASTASPFKFSASVLDALGKKPADGTDEYDMVELLHEVSSMEIPQSLAALKTKPRRFDGSIDKSEMQQFVLQELHLS